MTQPSNTTRVQSLSAAEIKELSEATQFSEKQVKDWQR